MSDSLHSIYRGRRVLVTGHTGFKGSWLCKWLLQLGADVRGYAMNPPTEPCLFEQLDLASQIDDVRGDVRDREKLFTEVKAFQPEIVFHLAAQPLVRYSFSAPIETYETNTMGTVYLLDALRRAGTPCVAIMVTTDKCYENREWHYGYREDDPMGGSDPYSSSKGMAELALSSYRQSFLKDSGVRAASVRAGNVIGGGDWALDRIVPDSMRALSKGHAVRVRNPNATRPWQHVLEPLHGYLQLASQLLSETDCSVFETAFNFGPTPKSNRCVRELVESILREWPGEWRDESDRDAVHEATLLHLNVDKAASLLNWHPRWGFETTVKATVRWYRDVSRRVASPIELTQNQICDYEAEIV